MNEPEKSSKTLPFGWSNICLAWLVLAFPTILLLCISKSERATGEFSTQVRLTVLVIGGLELLLGILGGLTEQGKDKSNAFLAALIGLSLIAATYLI